MENFLVAVSGAVGAAVVQEAVSRGVSFVLGKRKVKASQGQYLERLRKAVKEVEFMLERTAKMPITEVSLLRDRFEVKRDFIEASRLLSSRHKKRLSPQGQPAISQVVTHSSSPHGWCSAMFSVSSFIDMMTKEGELHLSCADVERFEQFADSAQNIVRRVESSCSLRRYMFFPCPLVRHLFAERKTLIYSTVQAQEERFLHVWPAHLEEERGVEARVVYRYTDQKRLEKSFELVLVLRLSESTDIVGVALNCLQSLASQSNLVADTAMGELTLLANLQGGSSSHAPPWIGFQEWHSKITHICRPDPLCCKEKGHGPRANNVFTSSELSQFPEEVIGFRFQCYISAGEYSLCGSGDEASVRKPPLQLEVNLAPHHVLDERQQASYAVEVIGDRDEERIDVGRQQVGEMVRSRAINCFLHEPKVTEYMIVWATKHGTIGFNVQKLRAGALKTRGRLKSRISAKARYGRNQNRLRTLATEIGHYSAQMTDLQIYREPSVV